MILDIILKYLGVYIIIALVFGVQILSTSIVKRIYKDDFKGAYLFQFWSLILALVAWYLKPEHISFFGAHSLWRLRNIVLILICIIPTAVILCVGRKYKPNQAFSIENFLSGASMEIPQRLLIQNLFTLLGVNVVIYRSMTLAIFLNALVWVQGIITQELIGGNKLSKKIIPEIIASFWFSIWVGIVYVETGNILIAMLTHGLQRLITHGIRVKFGKPQMGESSF